MRAVLLVCALAGVASADVVDELPTKLTSAKTVADVQALLPGMKAVVEPVSDGTKKISVTFSPRDAKKLAAAWKLARPYAISGDVHQQTWEMMVWDQDVPDPNGKRIHAKTIHSGRWILHPHLVGRPEGALPKVSAGASPAYDLTTYPAKIDSIEIYEPGANRD